MVRIVNAKINIGLQIVRRRDDGYHELRTIFYPVGLYAGTPENPESFGDILEVTPRDGEGFGLTLTGRPVDCPVEKNLVYRAARLYFERLATPGFGAEITMEKHLPDGAGCGGGSADAAMTLDALSQLDRRLNDGKEGYRERDDKMLAEMALELGADCPFFIYNRPMYGEGVGEKLSPVDLSLEGCWLTLVKPNVSVSTRQAFAGVTPHEPDFDLRRLPGLPMEEWRGVVVNDFEKSVFAQFPEIGEIKERLYQLGARYASMTGSGSSVYGIFGDETDAAAARDVFASMATIQGAYLLKM